MPPTPSSPRIKLRPALFLTLLSAPVLSSAAPGPAPHTLAGYTQAAAGLSAALADIVSFEPVQAPASEQNRLVIVAGLDQSVPPENADSSASIAKAFIAWWSSPEAEPSRARWQIAVVPNALPGGPNAAPLAFPPLKGFFNDPVAPEYRYLWRWTAMCGPDLVVDLRSAPQPAIHANAPALPLFPGATPTTPQELTTALGTGAPSGLAPVPAIRIEGSPQHLRETLRSIVARDIPHSKLRETTDQRAKRTPLEIARLLASRYPNSPGMSYIPALAWSGAFRVSLLTKEPSFREKALGQMMPFLNGTKPALADNANLPSVAGHLAFSDLAGMESAPDAAALARKAAEHLVRPSGSAENLLPSATRWTDDMFMASAVLARVAGATREAVFAEATQRLLQSYSARLQRPDGVFIHVESSPFAWGRGNGFAAFGLMEALTHLPENTGNRDTLLAIFRKQMHGMIPHQSPDGTWRQVIDEPGAYRELTATAMITTAMARGVRLGWLERDKFLPAVERGWRAIAVRVGDDAALVDVCTGTGAKKDCDRSHYLHRDAIFGPDDRGGAMALTLALEIHALRSAPAN
jgi:rhamnogalacturonyl hydrolase YesR